MLPSCPSPHLMHTELEGDDTPKVDKAGNMSLSPCSKCSSVTGEIEDLFSGMTRDLSTLMTLVAAVPQQMQTVSQEICTLRGEHKALAAEPLDARSPPSIDSSSSPGKSGEWALAEGLEPSPRSRMSTFIPRRVEDALSQELLEFVVSFQPQLQVICEELSLLRTEQTRQATCLSSRDPSEIQDQVTARLTGAEDSISALWKAVAEVSAAPGPVELQQLVDRLDAMEGSIEVDSEKRPSEGCALCLTPTSASPDLLARMSVAEAHIATLTDITKSEMELAQVLATSVDTLTKGLDDHTEKLRAFEDGFFLPVTTCDGSLSGKKNSEDRRFVSPMKRYGEEGPCRREQMNTVIPDEQRNSSRPPRASPIRSCPDTDVTEQRLPAYERAEYQGAIAMLPGTPDKGIPRTACREASLQSSRMLNRRGSRPLLRVKSFPSTVPGARPARRMSQGSARETGAVEAKILSLPCGTSRKTMPAMRTGSFST